MPELSHDIKTAIDTWVERDFDGNESEAARHAGVSRMTIARYREGGTRDITAATWRKLRPYVSKYMPPQDAEPRPALTTKEAELVDEILTTGTEEEKRRIKDALGDILIERATRRRAQ